MSGEAEKAVKPTEAENQGDKPTEAQNQGIDGVQFEDGIEETPEVEVETETEKAVKPETPEEKEIPQDHPAAKTDEEINQEAVQKRIDKLTFKRREAEEKAQEAIKKFEEAQEEIKRLKGESDKVEVPPMPDPYDENYAQLMKEREAAIEKKARLDAQAQYEIDRQNKEVERQRRERLQEIDKNASRMFEAAEKHGFKKEDFAEADVKVGRFIKHMPDVAAYILRQKDSHLIVQQLSTNIEELEDISKMSPIDAVGYIAGTVVPKAQQLKVKPSEAPEPLDLVKSKGGGQEKSPYLDGVSFE